MKLADYHHIDDEISNCEIKYDNTNISYIARLYLIAKIREKKNTGNKPVRITKFVLLRIFKGVISTFKELFTKSEYIVFSNAERRKMFFDVYYDRVGSIANILSGRVLYIENPVLVDHKKPTKDKILSEGLFFILSALFSLLYYRRSKLKIDEKFYNLANREGVDIKLDSVVRRFIGQYKCMLFYIRYINRPKLVFSIYPGSYLGYNFAFKEHNIPIVELQHGVIYPTHFSYNTTLFDSSKKFKPDFIFTYGNTDKECLVELNYLPSSHIHVVGSYGLQLIREQGKGQVSSYLEKLSDSTKTVVAIIATTTDIDELFSFSLELETLSAGKFKILLLPRHALDLEDTANVKILDINKVNVFELYTFVDFLVTKSSTAALESLFMNVPTFIYEPERGQSLFSKNYSFLASLNYVSSPAQTVDSILKKNYKSPTEKDVSNIYAKNIYANFKKAMQEVERSY